MQPEPVRAQLAKVLSSEAFQSVGRSGKLLAFLVERTIDGRADELKEYTLGAEALGRGSNFDPRTDSIARVEASRLRTKLDLYYATEGRADPLRIILPKGSYIPQFEAVSPTPSSTDAGRIWKWAALAATLIAIAAIAWALRRPATLFEPALRLEVNLGSAVSLQSAQVGSSSVIISPDGTRLVFVSFRNGVPRLMTKLLTEESQATEIPGTEGARGPFFSPSGEWVAFQAGGKLKKVQLSGGSPVVLCDCLELLGGSWGDDDVIVAKVDTHSLSRIPAAGGSPTPIDAIEGAQFSWPHVLPGSKAILVTDGRPGAPQTVAVYSLIDHKTKPLASGSYARYFDSGYIAYLDRGTVLVAPFDLDRLEITGPRATLIGGVVYTTGFGSAEFDVSRNGRMVYRRASGQGRIVAWVDAGGEAMPVLSEPAPYMWPRLSPDGSMISYMLSDRDEETTRVFDIRAGRSVQVLFGPAMSSPAVWTPDARFLIGAHPGGGLQWTRADGAGTPQRLSAAGDVLIPWSMTPSGDRLAVYRRGLDPQGSVTFDLWTIPLRAAPDRIEAGEPEPFLVSDAFETYPEFSPDGRWIAYTSLESGSYDVYVRSFPDSGRKWVVSRGGGRHARWTRDGRLFYSSHDHRVMEVRYTVRGDEFSASAPRVWREQPLADTTIFPDFDVAPDGRILGLLPAPEAEQPQDEHHVTVMLNVFDEVARLANK